VKGRGREGLGTSVPSTSATENEREKAASVRPPFPVPRPPSVPLSILLLGDANRPEFHDARACTAQCGTVAEFDDVDRAAAALAEGRISPEVIVAAQAFPGQFSHQAIDRLRRLAPLARVLGLMGSWCEGEMRSGSPWPAVVRTYWHQWPARCNRQFRRLAMGQPCSWALPLTATEEERLLADMSPGGADILVCPGESRGARQECPPHQYCGLVAIRSQSRESAEWLSAVCRSHRLATVCQRDSAFVRVEGAMAGIFDGTDLCGDEHGDLHRFVIALRPAPVIVLLSFPRIEDHRRALSAGASTVLSKPLFVEDLFESLSASIRDNQQRPALTT
jgi:hypothetical protein